MASVHNEPVVVLGLGRFGSSLALELASRGTEVLGIDINSKIVDALAGRLTNVATADCTDGEALRQLGVPEFQRAVVAIGTDLEASVLTTVLLTDLGISHIWAKALNRRHAEILSRVGAHHVVLPEQHMGERIAHLLSGRMLDYVEVDQDFAMIKTKPPRDIVGVPLRESRLRSRYGVTVVAVKSEALGAKARFGYATADTVLMYGDLILVVGTVGDLERFAESD
ncbi:potassium channel family protein [Micromonospora sp. CPCC 206061]|uniref:potassium channel family protein n=1 Tax=Micromonospora sp. CPCC 206061 TaxID=3122410 RepID=UPI002FF0640C